jgi:hypothetical protein
MPRVARRRALAAALLLGLAAPAAAGREPRQLRVRFPPFTVPAGASGEFCALVRLPLAAPFDLGRYEIRHAGMKRDVFPRHFLVYLYAGEHLAAFAAEAGRVVPSRACLDLGPEDRDRRLLVASGAQRRSRGGLPPGIALPLAPVPAAPGGAPEGIGLVLDAEWLNGSARSRRVSTRLVLRRARAKDVRRRLRPILERTAERGLRVPPFGVQSTEATTAALNGARPGEAPLLDAWGPGLATTGEPAPAGDACVLFVSGHMHKRARFFGVDVVRADGTVETPPAGTTNPFEPERRHLFGSADYTDPGVLRLFPPRLLRAGERLRYACWVDNGVATAVRLGCEEVDGVPPGEAVGLPGGGAAKPCALAGPSPGECPPSDPAYPGRRFTGLCRPANAVAGASPEDEACALVGFYFDAVAGAPAGAECDARQAPRP